MRTKPEDPRLRDWEAGFLWSNCAGPRMVKPKTVDEYISMAPPETRALLKEIRKIIRTTAPKAVEKISYGMPYYGYEGRLVYFAHAKEHVGVYAMMAAMDAMKDEVKKYRTSKATLRFPLNEKLPAQLIKKLVKIQMKKNEEKKK
jgi:uncharacterized protein YdhG (YjbR/CyaY superfamily)